MITVFLIIQPLNFNMTTTNSIKRKVPIYFVFVILSIKCGLIARLDFYWMPVFISTYAGDTLWALIVFWCLCLFFRHTVTWKLSLIAFLFSLSIEFSQFYHAPWIDTLRSNKLGGLILGFGFKSSDLVCYSVGIICGSIIDLLLIKSDPK